MFQLGQTQVTLPSHIVTWLANRSPLISFFLKEEVIRRWSLPVNIISFPEEVLSRDFLYIFNKISRVNDDVNLRNLLQSSHYLQFSEYYVLEILELNQCIPCLYRRFCYIHHRNYRQNRTIIPAMYFARYICSWNAIYEAFLKHLDLKDIEVDDRWSYARFKKQIRGSLRSSERWYDDDHFKPGEWRRSKCHCFLCRSGPPDPNGNGWV